MSVYINKNMNIAPLCLFHTLSYLHVFLQKGDLFKDVLVFANDGAILEETLRNSSVFDWTSFLCLGNNNNYYFGSLHTPLIVSIIHLNAYLSLCSPSYHISFSNQYTTKGKDQCLTAIIMFT